MRLVFGRESLGCIKEQDKTILASLRRHNANTTVRYSSRSLLSSRHTARTRLDSEKSLLRNADAEDAFGRRRVVSGQSGCGCSYGAVAMTYPYDRAASDNFSTWALHLLAFLGPILAALGITVWYAKRL